MPVIMNPQYSTMLFQDIFPDAEEFTKAYNAVDLKGVNSANINKLYYLLYGKYGNNPIANKDINQFKYKLFGLIFMYGPTWEKRLEIQEKLRALKEDDILKGSTAIYNHAFNPSTEPSTQTLNELKHINDQNVTKYTKSVMDGYMQLWMLLDNDVTNDFLNKFKILFKQFVSSEDPTIYETEVYD